MQCLSFKASAPTLSAASSPQTLELPPDLPFSEGTSTDGTPRSSALFSPINLTHEYTLAVQTDSYNEIWSRIQEQVQVENAVENPDDNQLFLSQVLQPNRESVAEALGQAKKTTLTRLVTNYFDHSEDTTSLCVLLYQSVYRARAIYSPLHELLGVFPDDPDDVSDPQCNWALEVFRKFDSFDNPFPCPDSHNFDEIRRCFSTLRHDLDRRLHKSKTRVRLLRRAGAGSVLCLVGTVIGVAVSAAIISTHALAAVIVTPFCFGYGPGDYRKKEMSNVAQLEAAARGTYVLNNDLDTIDRLVSRLYTAIEGDKLLVRLGLERSRDKYPINQVVKQLRKNQANFIDQLVDLEEHICLCFNTVNKARSILLQKLRRRYGASHCLTCPPQPRPSLLRLLPPQAEDKLKLKAEQWESRTIKFKKQKRHRRAVKFFSACFGFREPFKVLCDGTFVHHLLTNKLLPANEAIPKCLSAPVKLFTIQCCLVELRKLGSDFSSALEAAQQLAIARCDHGRKAADDCVMDVIGESNSELFFFASQDAHLRQRLRVVPGVPLIFGLRNALFLEQPSPFQHQFVKSAEEKRMQMPDKEKELPKRRNKSLLADDGEKLLNEDEGSRSLQSHNTRKHSGGYRLGVNNRPGPQFKRKKAKAPNPLSCKKKQLKKQAENSNFPKKQPESSASTKEQNDVGSTPKSKSRKRKRSGKGKMLAETNGP